MTVKSNENIILADCKVEEIKSFAEGCNVTSKQPFRIITEISNWGYDVKIKNFVRYLLYFIFPFRILLRRKRYGTIIGWQQFYAINLAFFSRLKNIKKRNTIVVGNFTYKRKSGLVGKLYHFYMKFSCNNKYVDYLHVPSHNYVQICSKELGINENKFIVTGFGVPDTYKDMKGLKAPLENYSFSIGRSNRDFDFLVKVWEQGCLQDKLLVIASDTWKPAKGLPDNVIFRDNIKYDESFAWFNSSDLCVTSIADGNICSGDTVLLTGMMFAKPVVVTSPSTLAEMYVKDGINGIHISKEVEDAAKKIAALLDDKGKMSRIGKSARESFLSDYSRRSMGISLCSQIDFVTK